MEPLAHLYDRIRHEAERGDMSIDTGIYEEAGKSPLEPILFGGRTDAAVAVIARDLGRDEVQLGEPLIGGAGQRVRRALYRAIVGSDPPAGDRRLADTTGRALLTNTVPYKPVGNKAYPPKVRERFRPFLAELLVCHWKGDYVITMGTEAFKWFEPYAGRERIEQFWSRPDRYEADMEVDIEAQCDGKTVRKSVTVAPLPHPSPLNRTYLELFPDLLDKRLAASPLRGG